MKNAVFCFGLIALSIVGCKDNSKAKDDLAWLNNTYNPHPHASGGMGHGSTGQYERNEAKNRDELVLGSTESFSNNDCDFTILIHDNPNSQTGHSMRSDVTMRVSLRDIDPTTVKVKTFSHYGGLDCGQYSDTAREVMQINCDSAEVDAVTRNSEPVVQTETHIIFDELTGKDHDVYSKDKDSKIFFEIDDPEYAKKFSDVFRDTVIQCGGTKGAGS